MPTTETPLTEFNPGWQAIVWGIIAATVSALFFSVIPLAEPPINSVFLGVLHGINHFLWWEWYLVGAVVFSVVASAVDMSVQKTVLILFGFGFGIGVNLGGFAITGDVPGVLFRIVWGTLIGGTIAIGIGLPGYLVSRWVKQYVR